MFDINIQVSETKNQLISDAIKLGYDGIAWNLDVHDRITQEHVNMLDGIVQTSEQSEYFSNLRLKAKEARFRQLKRVTLHLNGVDQLITLGERNSALGGLDLVAVRPGEEKLFHRCCEESIFDLVSFDISQRLPFPLRQRTIGVAIERGIFFEITISGALRDDGARRYVISNAMAIFRATRGKNLILSSGAMDAMGMRDPYSLMNLGILFGLDAEKAKRCISNNVRSCVIHGETRRMERSVMSTEEIGNMPEIELWKIDQGMDISDD